MYYIFKSDPWGNKIPCFASQGCDAATRFIRNSKDALYGFYVKGNAKTILNL